MLYVNVLYTCANNTARMACACGEKCFPSTEMFLTVPGEESEAAAELSVYGA